MSQQTQITNLDDLLTRLQGVKRVKENNYLARCPAHADHNPSLSIKLAGDKILLNCLAGCDVEKVLESLDLTLADLFLNKKDNPSKRNEKPKVEGKIEKIYPYCDEQNKVIFEVVRYQPKDFSFRRPNGKGGHIDNLNGVQRVIYRLPQIKAAITRKDLICHVEGEKDADNLVKLGLEATTSPMGAKAWNSDYAQYYAGAKLVAIFPDKDETRSGLCPKSSPGCFSGRGCR
jgi:DNA primase